MVAFESIQARLIKRLINPAWKYSEYLSGETRTHAEQIKIIRDFGRSIIQEKQVEGGEKNNDLLSLLMRVKDDEGNLPSHDDLVDYVLNFLLA
ncbi:hypothetical protein HDU99_008356, partial [Rhizoclosmatium hyalinum]